MKEGRKERSPVLVPVLVQLMGYPGFQSMHSALVGGSFYRQFSHFLCRMFFQTFLEVGQRALGPWVILIFPYALCPLVSLIPALV